jgi:hypothetical protein
MQISTFLLAESPNETADAKIDVRGGGIADFVTPAYPCEANLFAVLVIDIDPIDNGEHTLEIHVINADGKILGGQLKTFTAVASRRTVKAVVPITLHLVESGLYRCDVRIDNRIQSNSRPLTAHPAPRT